MDLKSAAGGIKTTIEAAIRFIRSFAAHGRTQFTLIAVGTLLFQSLAFLVPSQPWLPSLAETSSFVKALWQVHASVLGVSVVVVSIIITVIAGQGDRVRTWNLYSRETQFLKVIWFNLFLVLSIGLASLQIHEVESPLVSTSRVSNLVLTESILFVLAILLLIRVFTITVKFMNEDYVDDLAQSRIMRAIPGALERDLRRTRDLADSLQGATRGN